MRCEHRSDDNWKKYKCYLQNMNNTCFFFQNVNLCLIKTNYNLIAMNVKALIKNTLTFYFPFSQNCLFNVVMHNLTFSTSVSISGLSSLPKLPSHNSNCLQNSCYCCKSLRCNISVRLSFLQNHFLLSYFHWGTMILSVTQAQIISRILDSVSFFLPNNFMY